MKYPSAQGVPSFRVLVVDKELQVLALLSTLLEHYGHDVRSASSCKEALAVLDGFRPDVVFTGIVLLASSGFDLAKTLRSRPDFDKKLIIALTGNELQLTAEQWAMAGFDQVLRKPTDIEDIVEVLKDASLKNNSISGYLN